MPYPPSHMVGPPIANPSGRRIESSLSSEVSRSHPPTTRSGCRSSERRLADWKQVSKTRQTRDSTRPKIVKHRFGAPTKHNMYSCEAAWENRVVIRGRETSFKRSKSRSGGFAQGVIVQSTIRSQALRPRARRLAHSRSRVETPCRPTNPAVLLRSG
jgi:hypothetical protein